MPDYPMILPNGKTVVDERCECGALLSEHEALDAHGIMLPNRGGLGECKRFTWAGFLYKDGTED